MAQKDGLEEPKGAVKQILVIMILAFTPPMETLNHMHHSRCLIKNGEDAEKVNS